MLHLSSWMTTLPMMLIGMTGILLVIGFLVLVVMALNCLTRRKYRVINAKRTAVQRTAVLFISIYLLMESVPKAVSSKWLLYSSCISLMSERVSSAPAVS